MPQLTPIQKQYILHWGEMGTKWGINRTVAQIHALLYLSPKPLPADEIAETLAVARSNVSTSIRELESWGIVRPVHVLGELLGIELRPEVALAHGATGDGGEEREPVLLLPHQLLQIGKVGPQHVRESVAQPRVVRGQVADARPDRVAVALQQYRPSFSKIIAVVLGSP